MKKVMVTGADGFLGKHLVTKLLASGYEVIAVVYPGNSIGIDNHEKLIVLEMDLTKDIDAKDFPQEIDTLYHLAWIGVNPEARNNMDVQVKNLEMAINVMKLSIDLNIFKVVLPGSTNEYLYYGKPINANATPSPSNAYGAVKVSTRYICAEIAKRNNICFNYAIITGIYAADRKDSNVIYYTIEKLLRAERPSLSKLEQLWDYVYIDDAINALVAIGKSGLDGRVYAIGHGDNWALKNYIYIIHNLIDSSIPLGIGDIEYEQDMIPSSCVDIADLTRDTGFVPGISFEEGISKVIDTLKQEIVRETLV